MTHARHISAFAFALLIFGFALPVFANTTNKSSDPSYANGPFMFSCIPYYDSSNIPSTTWFADGGTYAPTTGPCVFTLPNTLNTSTAIYGGVYKGVPGSAQFVVGEQLNKIGSPTLVQEDNVSFSSAQQNDNYFAVVFTGNAGSMNTFFQSGGTAPAGAIEGQTYYVLPWTWASDITPPAITITTPQDGASYLTTDSVTPSVSISDDSGSVASAQYLFNDTAVDPNVPLPLSSAPLGSAEFVVSATDAAGNTGYATSTFTIEAPVVPPSLDDACGNLTEAPEGYTLVVGTNRNERVELFDHEMYVDPGGNNVITGDDGDYIVCTGNGNDRVTLGNGAHTVDVGDGNNTVRIGDGDGTVIAGNGNDNIQVGTGKHTINAGGGNNNIQTGDDDQTVTTGDGNDTVTTGSGNDIIQVADGNDHVQAGTGTNTCDLGSGHNNSSGCTES